MDYGLITKKHRHFFAKFLEILIQRINFVKEIPVDSVHDGPTMDGWHRAHRISAFGHSGA
jgi:hypothetical protein